MRLPNAEHEAHPWVISRIAPDFKLLDAWALPVEGGPDDFTSFLETLGSFDPTTSGSIASRSLFWVRLRLGALFGWDDPGKKRPIPGCSEMTLRDRVPEELRDSAEDSQMVNEVLQQVAGGFRPLYRTDHEAAAEISNDTVHGVLHLGWLEQDEGRYRAQMGVYVKARGVFGEIYLKLIEPFRHYIVYPALLRRIDRAWNGRRHSPVRGE